jgi:tetratricopeptide (TPR) repeat protein
VPQYRKDLAETHNNLGVLLVNTGRPKDAEGAFRDGLDLYKGLAAEFPDVPMYRDGLAVKHMNLGHLLQDTGHPKEAEVAYREARDLQKQLVEKYSTVPEYRRTLANTQVNLGILLRDTGRPQEAEAAYHDALDLFKRLATDSRNVPDYQNDVGNTLDELGELARRRKDYPAALRLLEEAEPYLKKALDANPRNPVYRHRFCENRQWLGATLLELGEHAAASTAAAELARIAAEPASDAYKAACFFSRCIPLAEKDAKLPQARRQELAKSYGDRAVQALRQALAKGYQDAAQLKKDKDLDPLRGRNDFRKLLAELEKGAGKDKPQGDQPQK